jgi:Flp pilus assembly protein TadG
MSMKASLRKFANRWRALRRAEDGNITILFAASLIPVVGLVGAAIDYTRASAIRTSLQAAVDSTALAVSRDAPNQTAAQLQAAAQAYFNALFTNQEAKGVQIAATYNASGGSQVTVTASGSIKPKFMSMAPFGFSDMPVGVSSTTAWGMSRLRVALVLDNTGSMASAGKMDALKTATKNLLNQLKAAATTNGDVYVSIVPFSKDVNVGASNSTATWIDWTAWDAANSGGGSWGGGGGGGSWGGGGGGSGWGGGSATPNHSTWNGCIMDRGTSSSPATQNYDQTVAPPVTGTAASLYPAEQYAYCPAQMMGLSYDWTALNSKVDSMIPVGSTNQPIGLVWGWLSLAGGGPLTAPPMDPNFQYSQVIILLSDGLNTQDRWYGNGSSVSAQVDARMYDTNNAGIGTCKNIKAAGITIYTVHVNTDGDPTSTLLQNCASSADKFFILTSANAIITTFNTIGTNLSRLRVAK